MTLALRRASNRAAVSLGDMLGQGGEGAVYPVTDTPDLVAKIYHEPPSSSKAEKLLAMTRTATPKLLRVAAWPVDLLIDETDAVRGFLMPRVAAREDAHELYSPKSRRQAFPRADFRFVVRASANLARALATVHLHGHVIGDINHGNALIGKDSTVVLIDCDSFQIRDGERSFACDVGVALFTPPELHGLSFRGLRRSVQHDGFGLAVLLFHLLYAGRHPFAGRYSAGEMTIEQAIAESRFAYGASAASLDMSPPPAALLLDTFGPQIASLFERAFAKPGSSDRPAATEWVVALEQLEAGLQRCATMPLHFHPRAGVCCWCEIETIICIPLFGPAEGGLPVPVARLHALWNAIEAVPRPQELEPQARNLSAPDPRPIRTAPRPDHSPADRLRLFPIGWSMIIAGFAIGYASKKSLFGLVLATALVPIGALLQARWFRDLFTSESDELMRAAFHRLDLAEEAWARMKYDWLEAGRADLASFASDLEELTSAQAELSRLPETRVTKMADLHALTVHKKKDEYLRRFPISEIDPSLLGPDDLAVLARNAVYNAGDVVNASTTLHRHASERLSNVLLAWCQQHASAFDESSVTLDPRDIAELDERLRDRRQDLLERLHEGPAVLQTRVAYIAERRELRQQRLDSTWGQLEAAQRAVQVL